MENTPPRPRPGPLATAERVCAWLWEEAGSGTEGVPLPAAGP